jgi:hypothetical protein
MRTHTVWRITGRSPAGTKMGAPLIVRRPRRVSRAGWAVAWSAAPYVPRQGVSMERDREARMDDKGPGRHFDLGLRLASHGIRPDGTIIRGGLEEDYNFKGNKVIIIKRIHYPVLSGICIIWYYLVTHLRALPIIGVGRNQIFDMSSRSAAAM